MQCLPNMSLHMIVGLLRTTHTRLSHSTPTRLSHTHVSPQLLTTDSVILTVFMRSGISHPNIHWVITIGDSVRVCISGAALVLRFALISMAWASMIDRTASHMLRTLIALRITSGRYQSLILKIAVVRALVIRLGTNSNSHSFCQTLNSERTEHSLN